MSDKQLTREQRRKANEQRKKKSNKTNKKQPAIFWLKRAVLAVLILGVAGLVFGLGLFTFYASSSPDLDEDLLRDPISPTFLAADGETEIAYITSENREYINYDEIPQMMEDAILATEDNRFYSHSGIDVIRLGGAVIANVTGGFGSQGASTITQQVIKNSFLTNDKNLKRKSQEAYLAYKLERQYEKEEIFEMYFNKILMSGNTYGFGTASQHFYGKPLNELELHEAALLAGMPQSPNGYNPFRNPEAAETRRNIVLSLMEQHGKITTAEKEEAQAASATDSLLPEEQRPEAPTGEYTAFMEMVEDELQSLEGDFSLDEGLTIYTTLEPDVQKAINGTMASDLFFNEEVQSAMTIVDTQTGAIRGVGAAREYSGDVRRNFATSRDRVIGSTIKPLVVYGPAIEFLDWSTGKTMEDRPHSYESGQEIRNVDGEFLGTMTMREALYRSRNIPAVKALQEVESSNASSFTQQLGLDFGNIYESTALGTADENISTVDMAGAFAAFGNEGSFTKPHTITKIQFRDGSEQDVAPETTQAMKDSTAYMVTDMLRDVMDTNINGSTGKEASIGGLDIAGKTGTSNYTQDRLTEYGLDASSAPDIWFAGYTVDYSVSVWSGYPSQTNAIDTASQERLLAQRLFKDVMTKISTPGDTGSFQQPESVVELEIEKGTEPLQLSSSYTPSSMRSTELFVRGSEPTQVSEEFVQEDLDAPTSLRADVEGESANLSWNYGDSGDISFEVSVTANGSRSVLTTTDDLNYTFNGLEEGTSYTFSVVAIDGDNRSDPASVIVEIAAREEEVEEEETEEPVEEEPVEEEPVEEEPVEEEPVEEEPVEEEPVEEEPVEEDNGNGNGNGNGSGNGNGNGNNDDGESDDESSDANPASTPETDEEPTDEDEEN